MPPLEKAQEHMDVCWLLEAASSVGGGDCAHLERVVGGQNGGREGGF